MNDLETGEMATLANAAVDALNSDVFNKAFATMNSNIIDQILCTPMEAAAERERLYAMYKAGQMFVQQFAGFISSYEVATQKTDE